MLKLFHTTSQTHTGSLHDLLGGTLDPLLKLTGEDGDDSVERREFILQTGLLAGLGVGGTASLLEAVRHELHRCLTDDGVTPEVDEWQQIALDYGQTCLVTAPATLLPSLIVDLHGMRFAMQRHPKETAQRKLLQAGALLAAFTATTVADLGDLVEARRWWRTARWAADQATDLWTMFWIRGHEVVRAGYEHRPIRAIVQLVNETETRLDGAPPDVLPGFFAGKAQTLALAGRHREAEQALHQVREHSSELSPPIGHRDSLFDWSEENALFTESFVYSHAGNFDEAEQAQQRTLTLYADSNVRDSAHIELLRSLCLVRSGDLTQGTRHAQETITSLPVMYRNRPVADLAEKVYGSIPAHQLRQSWAKEYGECIIASFPGQTSPFTMTATKT